MNPAQVFPHGEPGQLRPSFSNYQQPQGHPQQRNSMVTMDPKGGMPVMAPGNMMAAPMMQPPMYGGMPQPGMQPLMYGGMPQEAAMVQTPLGAMPMQYATHVPIANPIAPMFYAFPQDHQAAVSMNTMTRKLASVNKVKVVQQITLLEACCGCEQQNIYDIYDERGNQILQANEKSDTCTRLCCNPVHSLMVEISDADNKDDVIATMERPGKGYGGVD